MSRSLSTLRLLLQTRMLKPTSSSHTHLSNTLPRTSLPSTSSHMASPVLVPTVDQALRPMAKLLLHHLVLPHLSKVVSFPLAGSSSSTSRASASST